MRWNVLKDTEKERLLAELSRPAWALGPALMIGSGLLVLFIVGTAIGIEGADRPSETAAAIATASMHYRETAPIAASRKAFNERQERYITAYPESRLAQWQMNRRTIDMHSDGGYFYYAAPSEQRSAGMLD